MLSEVEASLAPLVLRTVRTQGSLPFDIAQGKLFGRDDTARPLDLDYRTNLCTFINFVAMVPPTQNLIQSVTICVRISRGMHMRLNSDYQWPQS